MIRHITSKRFLFFIILLSSLYFFTLKFANISIQRGIEFLASMLLLSLITYKIFTQKNLFSIKTHYKSDILLLSLSVVISMFMAFAFHKQSFAITFFAQKHMYFLFFYFFLHIYRFDKKFLERTFLIIGVTWCLIYLIQYFIFPHIILNSRVHLDRNTVRIFFPGSLFALVAYFIGLNNVLTKQIKLSYLMYLAIFFIIVGLLQGTRANLATLVFTTGLFIIIHPNVKKRSLIILIAFFALLAVLAIFWKNFEALFNLTKQQIAANQHEDPIRKKTLKFFLTDFMPNKLCYVFGNGMEHGRSDYGKQIMSYMKDNWLFLSDIGFIGEYVIWGVLFVIIELKIIIGNIFRKLPHSVSYLRYVYIYVLLTNITGAGAFVGSSLITAHMIMLYLIDVEIDKIQQPELTEKQKCF